MAEDFSRRVARVVAAQMAELTGFEAAQESAIEVLAELLLKYLSELCTAAHEYAEHVHRTEFNICDLGLALEDFGSSFEDLQKYLDSWLSTQGPGSHDQGFVHPLPAEYPVKTAGKTLPSFDERGEKAPAHIPGWLPAFPDKHTYVQTPTFPGHEQDPVKQHEAVRQQRKQAEKTALSLKQRLLHTPIHPKDVAASGNIFLAPPGVEAQQPTVLALTALPDVDNNNEQHSQAQLTQPASRAFEAVVGPASAPTAMDTAEPSSKRRELRWQPVATLEAEASGATVLNMTPGYSLDFATKLHRQGLAFASQRPPEDAFMNVDGGRGSKRKPEAEERKARAILMADEADREDDED